MLALEVEFLLGRYSATDYRDRDRPEWPPHPGRLFSALVSGAGQAGLGESAQAALLWLEAQPPHRIAASEAAPQAAVTAFVPVNDPVADYLPDRAEKQPRSFPSVVPERPTVHFVWPDSRPDVTLLGLLHQVAAAVTYLGSSRSPVRRCAAMRRPAGPTLGCPEEEGRLVAPRAGPRPLAATRLVLRQRPPAAAGGVPELRSGRQEREGPARGKRIRRDGRLPALRPGFAWKPRPPSSSPDALRGRRALTGR